MSTLKRSPTLVGVMVLALAFGLRFVLLTNVDGFPGPDGGAYLLSALSVQGQETTGTDFVRPPLAPGWLLVPFVTLFGSVTGSQVFAAVFSMPLALATWLLARSVLRPWYAVLVMAAVAFDWALMGLTVMGVVPMVGFACILVAAWALWGLSREFHWRYAAVLPIAIALIPFTNQTSAGLACIVLPLQWAMLPNKKQTAVWLAAGGLLALTALPWYLAETPANGKWTYPGPLVKVAPLWAHQLWLGLIAIGVAYWVFAKRPVREVRVASVLVVALAFLQMFHSHNEIVMNLMFRSTYLMLPFFWLCVGWAAQNAEWRMPRLPYAVPAALAIVSVTAYQGVEQARLSSYVDSATLAAMERIAPGSGRVVANQYSMALYIAAETQNEVLWVFDMAPPPAYVALEHEAHCTLGWKDCPVPDDVRWVLVNEKWPMDGYALAPEELHRFHGSPERVPWDRLATVPWLELVYAEGTVKLYEVNAERSA